MKEERGKIIKKSLEQQALAKSPWILLRNNEAMAS